MLFIFQMFSLRAVDQRRGNSSCNAKSCLDVAHKEADGRLFDMKHVCDVAHIRNVLLGLFGRCGFFSGEV